MIYRTFFHRNIRNVLSGFPASDTSELKKEMTIINRRLDHLWNLQILSLQLNAPEGEDFDVSELSFVPQQLHSPLGELGIYKVSELLRAIWSEESRKVLVALLKDGDPQIDINLETLKVCYDNIGLMHIKGISKVHAAQLSKPEVGIGSLRQLALLKDDAIENEVAGKVSGVGPDTIKKWRDQAALLLGLDNALSKKAIGMKPTVQTKKAVASKKAEPKKK